MKRDRTVWLTEPDAERLSLMQKFVRSPLEGRHLVALERKIALATICHPADVPADLVRENEMIFELPDPAMVNSSLDLEAAAADD